VRAAVVAIAIIVGLGVGIGGAAHAQPAGRELVIGLYAPSAPFPGTAQRLEFVRGLAEHVSAQIGRPVQGRVFAAAGALSAAIKGGEIQFAVLDAPYAAEVGMPYDILAAAVRGDSAVTPWRLVAGPGVRSLADLRGKTIAMPGIGPRDGQFIANTLLDGEVEPGFFGKIAPAPDALSAVTMVSVGRAQAAFVPSAIDLPGGVRTVVTLDAIGWPMFVAGPGVDRATADRVGRAVRTYSGSGTFTRFTSADAGRYRSIDLGRPSRKGPMAVPPPARLNVRDILEGRSFNLELTNVLSIITAPTEP
jgi:hypothetical protein